MGWLPASGCDRAGAAEAGGAEDPQSARSVAAEPRGSRARGRWRLKDFAGMVKPDADRAGCDLTFDWEGRNRRPLRDPMNARNW